MYGRGKLDYDTVGSIAIREDSHKGVSRIIFCFALEFVGLAMTADRADHDLQKFVEERVQVSRRRHVPRDASDHRRLGQHGAVVFRRAEPAVELSTDRLAQL